MIWVRASSLAPLDEPATPLPAAGFTRTAAGVARRRRSEGTPPAGGRPRGRAARRCASQLHFEPGRRRPHLVTSAAVRSAVPEDVRVDYLVALWLLLCAGLAIDQLTIGRGQIGLVLDNAIELTPGELVSLGLVRGSTRGGYRGDYFVFEARPR